MEYALVMASDAVVSWPRGTMTENTWALHSFLLRRKYRVWINSTLQLGQMLSVLSLRCVSSLVSIMS